MAGWKILAQLAFALIVLLVVLDPVEVDAVAGRFGGARYGGGARYRYSSTRTRVRYGSTSTRVRVRVRNGYGYGTRYWNWQMAAAAGAIYGYHTYSHRRIYYRNPDREPQICINEYDFAMGNGSKYSLFVCPLNNNPDSYIYCCGPQYRQYCCSFWQSPGKVAGLVIGLIVFFAIVGMIIYCCCCKTVAQRERYSIKWREKRQNQDYPQDTQGAPPSYPMQPPSTGPPAGGMPGKQVNDAPYPVNDNMPSYQPGEGPGYPVDQPPYPPPSGQALPYPAGPEQAPPYPTGPAPPYPVEPGAQPYPEPYPQPGYPPAPQQGYPNDMKHPTSPPPPYPK